MTMGSLLDLVRLPADFGTAPALMLDAALKATLLLAAAAVAVAILRRGSASVRHLAWASALAGSLAVPILAVALPSWRLAILPPPGASPLGRPSPGPAPSLVGSPEVASGMPAAASMAAAPPGTAGIGGAPAIHGTANRPSPGPTGSMRAAVDASAVRLRGWWIAAVWGAGAIAVMTPMAVGAARLQRLGRRSTRLVEGPEVEMTERLGARLRLRRRVVVLRGGDATMPMTWGVLRPVVFLPAGSGRWPSDRLRAVLQHELAHVARWDCLTQWVARLACALYWFHPLAWLAAGRMRVERERACDDLVLRSGARASDYAGHLLAVARSLRPAPGRSVAAAAVAMARPSGLEGRLRAILDHSRDRRGVGRRGKALALAAIAALLVPVSVARLGIRMAIADGSAGAGGDAGPSATMTVSGLVADPDGRPVPGARVAVVGRRKQALMTVRSDDRHELMGQAEADAAGRFRLDVPRTSSLTYYELFALAASPGSGLGWYELNRDAVAPSAEVALRPEQAIEGRLVDLQGEPAPGVDVRVRGLGVDRSDEGRFDGVSFWEATPDGLDAWPAPATTDAEGRFRIEGVGRGLLAWLVVDDLRFARQDLRVETDEAEGPKRTTLPLEPARIFAGRVTYADTGQPVPQAVVIITSSAEEFGSMISARFRADAEGRYRANPWPGRFFSVAAFPPEGSPYLIARGERFEWPDGEVERAADVAIPRGVLVTGRITERGTGRPLAGASVQYWNGPGTGGDDEVVSGWQAAVPSGPDGRFAIAVQPGRGHLLVYGPTGDFVHEVMGGREIYTGKPGGQRHYAHAFVPYEVEAGQEALEVDVALTPGATIAGRVEGPDGRPVAAAEILTTLSISPFHSQWRGDFTVPVRDGRFELHGVPADHPVSCSFLDAEHGWGTTIEVTGAMADEGPLAVSLEPCGAATARLVDEEGRPAADRGFMLNIVATPGPSRFDFGGNSLTEEEQAQLAADEEIYANVDRRNYWQGPRSDAEGRITLPALIPGATYRIYEPAPDRGEDASRWRDFSVEAGETLDLGDIRGRTDRG